MSTKSMERVAASAPTRAPDSRKRPAAPIRAGRMGHVYRPPMEASMNAASSTSATGSTDGRRRSARGRRFRVIALVLVAVVPRVVVAVPVEVNAIEDSRNRARMTRLKCLDCTLREAPARHLGAYDEGHGMHERREHDGVGHRQDWWSIDDHPVERTGRQLMQERAHAIRRQQLRRVRRRVARRNDEEVWIAAALRDRAHPR